MLRLIAALAALLFNVAAFAQTGLSFATQQVQLLAPQLVAFSGSTGNFDSLVTGLTTGSPVTLTTIGADGSLQIVTFVPGTALTPADAARVLEAARQNLIGRGIATPTGQQLAASLLGGTITTLSGSSAITGLLTGSTTPPTPIQVRTDAAVSPGGPVTSNLSAANLQAIRNSLATGTGQSLGFPQTGIRMSDFEVNQSLQLAAALLAQQGILDPTAEQLRAALFGGSLLTASGGTVPLQGVLQGRVRNTSDGPAFNTSASPAVNTSASPLFGTSNTPATVRPGTAQPPAGGTSAGASVAPRGSTAPIRPGSR